MLPNPRKLSKFLSKRKLKIRRRKRSKTKPANFKSEKKRESLMLNANSNSCKNTKQSAKNTLIRLKSHRSLERLNKVANRGNLYFLGVLWKGKDGSIFTSSMVVTVQATSLQAAALRKTSLTKSRWDKQHLKQSFHQPCYKRISKKYCAPNTWLLRDSTSIRQQVSSKLVKTSLLQARCTWSFQVWKIINTSL